MKCPNCNHSSTALNFHTKVVTVRKEKQIDLWRKITIQKETQRTCPKCANIFLSGYPILIREEQFVLRFNKLSKNLAETAELLYKKKKTYTLFEIQKMLKIPVPSLARQKIESMALAGLIKIIFYPASPKKDFYSKYVFLEEANMIILDSLGKVPLNEVFDKKIQRLKRVLSEFNGTGNKSQSRLISSLLTKQRRSMEFKDKDNGQLIRPSKYNQKYETIVEILIHLFTLIEKNKLVTTQELSKSLKLEMKYFTNIKRSLQGILDEKVLLFHILPIKHRMYLDPIPIPKDLSEEITLLELILRKYIIYNLLGHYHNFEQAYSQGIPLKITDVNLKKLGTFNRGKAEKSLQKQLLKNALLDRSVSSFELLLRYLHYGINSIELFEQFMQQTTFNHLILILATNWQSIFERQFIKFTFDDLVYSLREIKEARNIEAHRKYKLTEISKIIEYIYDIKKTVKPLSFIQFDEFQCI